MSESVIEGFRSNGHPDRLNRHLLERARVLIDEGHYRMAVVPAQLACEVRTKEAFASLYREKQLKALAAPRSGACSPATTSRMS